MDDKKIIAQIRLLNIYNSRIKIGKSIYKTLHNVPCEFCNLSENNIFHWIENCNLLKVKRKIFLQDCNKSEFHIVYFLNNLSTSELKKFVVFIKLASRI